LRHEISHTYHQLFQGKRPHEITPPPAVTAKKRGVGPKSRYANEAADVIAVKHRLHAYTKPKSSERYFGPTPSEDPTKPTDPEALAQLDDPNPSTELFRAIHAFQADEVESIRPDGAVDIPGKTWSALHGGTPPAEPEEPASDPSKPAPSSPPPASTVDPKRTLYCLLMHLQPVAIDGSLATQLPWLTRVKLEPAPGDPDPAEEAAKRARREREE